MLYENVFQNPDLLPTQVSLYPEYSTLGTNKIMMGKIVQGTYKIMMGKSVLGTYKIMMGKIVLGIYIMMGKIVLEVDTTASILHGVKIVQIHNITRKPAKIYVLSLYNLDAM
jgi:hypothetical protein